MRSYMILNYILFQLYVQQYFAFNNISLFSPRFCESPRRSKRRNSVKQLSSMEAKFNDNENLITETLLHPTDAKGIIFDIDGTLADSWKLGFDATQVVLKNNGIQLITEESYHECTRYCTPDRLARHAGLVPDDDEFKKVGENLAREFDDLYVGLVSLETAGFYDGIVELVLNLPTNNIDEKRNVKIAALTNACVAYAHSVLKCNCPILGETNSDNLDTDLKTSRGVYNKFLSIHGADTVPQPKPDPSGLLQCCKEIDLCPKDCVYVGDSPSDAVAAKQAGMIAIGVLWGSHPLESLRQAPFDYLCETVEELQSLLLDT